MSAPKGKKKFQLWAYPNTLELMRNTYKKTNCRTQSEFIERAIQYYCGHVNAADDVSYLPNAFLSNMKSLVNESDNRQGRMMFKLAVEMAMIMNILASMQDISDDTLRRLRHECINEVKRLNGGFTFEDAVEWQRDD